ncbi:radical SAM protein [Candidatus Woesearchaeota archaeon]|jgi:radical SAM superfamily enzyme with C-terminal helix-hairpin-helix motif|nr:radical SAM protein [Candidatus Woesearchaeota archaeon]MBT6044995.1 radical SAM protein [Candidatus Woesearchaeota archaeon]
MIYEDTILDCYTDEPAGLGVPPYLGVHPRYLAGYLKGKVNYITIDDVRNYFEPKKEGQKTNIKAYNLTRKSIKEVLEKTKTLYCVVGIQTPGKYLSALPGTIRELRNFLGKINARKILYGPVVSTGTQLQGGRVAERIPGDIFDGRMGDVFGNYSELASLAIKGTSIVKQMPWPKMIEIETGRGCIMGKCSFCTEPLKSKVEWREQKDIHNEIKALYDLGERNFRLGKQSCFFSYKGINTKEIEKLLKPIGRESKLNLNCLHIDNIIPSLVDEDRTKLLVKHCTEGNVAAFGVESFDMEVVKQNTLNTAPEVAMKAIRIINKFGNKRGPNGMHYLLPGLNLVLGLKGESKKTGEINYEYLKKVLDEKLLLRRINIRQVTPMPGTAMEEVGTKFIRKNKSKYWKWRNKIRKEIDFEMLQRLVPLGTVLKDVRMEVHDGNHTFGRQMGSYPLIVGVKDRIDIRKSYDLEVTGHMLRSVVGKVIKSN